MLIEMATNLLSKLGMGSGRDREALRTKVDALTGISLFKGLDERSLERLAEEAFFINYEPGGVLVEEGHKHGLSMFVIVSGSVKWQTQAGKSGELKAGKVVGEMSVIDSQPRSATVTAIEPTRCIQLTRDKVLKLMNANSAIATGLAIALATKLRETNQSQPTAPPAPPAGAAATSSNGSGASKAEGAAATEAHEGGAKGYKQQAQDVMLSTFNTLYTVKAMTRFSVAVLGCPVEGVSPEAAGVVRMGDVKAVFLPAGRAKMQVAAERAGSFTLHVFTPGGAGAAKFGPVELTPGQDCRLDIAGGAISLTRDGESMPRTDYKPC
jgi:hypothetical protein